MTARPIDHGEPRQRRGWCRYRLSVPWPTSRNRVDAIGRKLRDGLLLTEDETRDFAEIILFYEELATRVALRVGRAGYEPTSRGKTTGTTVEKLRREATTKLSRIHDMAGVRIVVTGHREQDQAAARIVEEFAAEERAPQVIDRRTTPSHGYRAVHVVVYPENIPAEVQIRTRLQDTWAQIVESLADDWGRGIRYGQEPEKPNRVVRVGSLHPAVLTRSQFVEILQQLSSSIAGLEEDVQRADSAVARIGAMQGDDGAFVLPWLIDLRADVESFGVTPELRTRVDEEYAALRGFAKRLINLVESDRRRRGRYIRRGFPRRAAVALDELEVRAQHLTHDMRAHGDANARSRARLVARLQAMLETLAQVDESGE